MSDRQNQNKRVTIYDVAARAGVSKSLVSLVLKGGQHVSHERRAAVQRAIEDLGYTPSRAATLLAGKSSRTIGVVIENYSSPWFVGVVEGLRSVLDGEGYRITVSDLHRLSSSKQDAVDAFMALHVDGIVLGVEPSAINLQKIPVPVVVVSIRASLMANADQVIGDDYKGSRAIVRHLIDLGHKKIFHITATSGPSIHRRQAYLDEMAEHGLETFVVGYESEPSSEDGYKMAVELMAAKPDLTAIFAANDSVAAGAIAHLRELGKSVPEDVSVVGFDNSPVARHYMFNLTTVDLATYEMGKEAAKLLLNRMDHPKRPAKQVVVPSELVLRGSTRAI